MGGVPNVRPDGPSTAKAVAALAHAARAYKGSTGTTRRSGCWRRPRRGWAYLEANPLTIPATGFQREQSTDELSDCGRPRSCTGRQEATRTTRTSRSLPKLTPTSGPRSPTTAAETPMRAFIATSRRPRRVMRSRKVVRPCTGLARAPARPRPADLAQLSSTTARRLRLGLLRGSNSVTLQTIVVIRDGRSAEREGFRLRAGQGGASAAQLTCSA